MCGSPLMPPSWTARDLPVPVARRARRGRSRTPATSARSTPSGTSHISARVRAPTTPPSATRCSRSSSRTRSSARTVARLRLPEPSSLGRWPSPSSRMASTPAERLHRNGRFSRGRLSRLVQTAADQVPGGRGRAERPSGGHTLGAECARRLRFPPQGRNDALACVSVIEVGSKATALSLRSQILAGRASRRRRGPIRSTRRPRRTEASSGASPTRTSTPRSTRCSRA